MSQKLFVPEVYLIFLLGIMCIPFQLSSLLNKLFIYILIPFFYPTPLTKNNVFFLILFFAMSLMLLRKSWLDN